MIHRSFTILVALTVLACPLVCHSTMVFASASRAEKPGCCDCCPLTNGPAQQGGPLCPTRPAPQSSGSCLCGGAVIDHAVMPDVSPDAGWSLPVAMIDALAPLQVAVAHRDNFSTPPPWAAAGMNPGRALCYLYGTILC